ncbi:NAD(P)-dependent dehydrogenase (short-subunit alcohol dehydrogenase family) [Stackebrandtia endophytica]|uniref:NAD(P)-dependent dehydrogenase (Short-subunit alcohol dehydrogenase family) n=1 Tax=Stackebrandtia endophytica TaxID=1496996 RepID=A0A543AY48_9ACTN|nr:SDR family oxidoreductase [Stackebrandtia endophytica]TQL77493.1 NAD(P)-dependent dehydrogenase (short-subunit alcohol dehydrogenase family) [Stackebrandtia endophytica]
MGIFSEKTVIVTGAGSGIGRATARGFAAEDATVIAVGRRLEPLVGTAAGDDRIKPLAVDITDESAPDRIAAAANRVDVLVNNAGIVGTEVMGELDRAAMLTQFDTNVFAPVLLTQAVLPKLVAVGGVIVNVSTSVGQRAWPGTWMYAASKTAIDLLSRSWGVELAPRGVRVVAVAPGAIDTRIGEHQGLSVEQQEQVRQWQIANTPQGRIGRPEEVAWAIVRLASPGASFITAAVVPVDGGAVAG